MPTDPRRLRFFPSVFSFSEWFKIGRGAGSSLFSSTLSHAVATLGEKRMEQGNWGPGQFVMDLSAGRMTYLLSAGSGTLYFKLFRESPMQISLVSGK